MKTYMDKAKCPKGHTFRILRRVTTAGRKVATYCRFCKCMHQIKAGPAPKQEGGEGA